MSLVLGKCSEVTLVSASLPDGVPECRPKGDASNSCLLPHSNTKAYKFNAYTSTSSFSSSSSSFYSSFSSSSSSSSQPHTTLGFINPFLFFGENLEDGLPGLVLRGSATQLLPS
ncbi:hypothetical protein E2C01_028687 [Portunus trituberculatus]|uniref:Uncharacterized protein n=1 Tax=Portunus trituberculatus TaxID=210409 RepID=A0A5B7EPR5_PORTR|nr:hypothetical protein [Portunus trituberculatus]